MQSSGRAPEACNGCWLICMLNVAVVIINLTQQNISVRQTTALEVALPPDMCFHRGRQCGKRCRIKLYLMIGTNDLPGATGGHV